jgi:PhnB protein
MKEIGPYLAFNGNCREAMTFYQQCLGGELAVQSFGDAGMDDQPESRDRVMHARLVNGAAVLMASDSMPGSPHVEGTNVSLSLQCDSEDEVGRLYTALSEGGNAGMPPSDTFWGARFGMLTDRYGMHWMLNFERPQAQ